MSDKARWVGPGAGGAPRSSPAADLYVTAKVEVDGSTHLGQIIEGVCFSMCNNAKHPILLPVSDGQVECMECHHIMRRRGIAVNTTLKLVLINEPAGKSKMLEEVGRKR